MSVVVPPFPVGDPDGMRALASAAKNVASQLDAAEGEINGAVKGMTFQGPAADRFMVKTQSIDARLRATASQLLDLAGRLDSAAADVDAQRAAYYSALHELEQEQRAAMLTARRVP